MGLLSVYQVAYRQPRCNFDSVQLSCGHAMGFTDIRLQWQ